jgi:polar amino acid transport system substrate-binding protein
MGRTDVTRFNHVAKFTALALLAGFVLPMATLPAQADALPGIKERGKLRVGMSAAYKPFEFVEGEKIVGFDPDVIAIIGEKLGVEVELIDTNWAGVVPSLYADKFDIIISAMTATPERAERVLFTQPYGEQTFYFMTSEEHADRSTAADFAGLTVAAEGGGAAQTGIEKWVADGLISFADQVYLSNPNEAYLAVKVGRADAAVDGLPGLMAFQQENPGFKLVEGFGPKQVMIMAIRKEDRDLCLAVNDVLTEIKADGRLEAIQVKWFDQPMPAEAELPDYLGVEICGGL